MVERRGDDALGPEAPGAQLVHADAGSHRVVAGPDPVVGGGGDDDPDPTRTAGRAAGDLSAHVRHGEPPCAFTHRNHLYFQIRKSSPPSSFKIDQDVVIFVLLISAAARM